MEGRRIRLRRSVHGGGRALKVVDDDLTANVDAARVDAHPGRAGGGLRLDFWTRAETEGPGLRRSCCEALDAAGRPVHRRAPSSRSSRPGRPGRTRRSTFRRFPAEVAAVRLRLFPAFRDNAGTTTGTVWFDDIVLAKAGNRPPTSSPAATSRCRSKSIGVRGRFPRFDPAARRYLDELGFNAFDLALQGLGTGSFYSRQEGVFGGFRQGTPEYDRLLSQYLRQVESHLAANGWLGREYIYWFDEPDPKDYPFVREGMLNIRKNAPRLTRFITEHRPGPEIMDVSEIGCTIFDRVDPKAVAELAPKGREFWSYLCTGPKSPWVTLFIDHPAVNLRMWLWMSYQWGLKGILVWRANYWTSPSLFPPDVAPESLAGPDVLHGRLRRPLRTAQPLGQRRRPVSLSAQPRSRTGTRRNTLAARSTPSAGRSCARASRTTSTSSCWRKPSATRRPPGPRRRPRPKPSLRLPADIFQDGKTYAKDPKVLLDYRKKVAAAIEDLSAAR